MQIEGTHGVDPLGIREGAKNLARADQAGPGAGKAAAGPVSESEGFEPYVRGAVERRRCGQRRCRRPSGCWPRAVWTRPRVPPGPRRGS